MSLLRYFLLFNALNILDGGLTTLGIELGIFEEANPATLFYIERLGLYQTMLVKISLGLSLSLVAYYKELRRGLILANIFYGLMVCYQIGSLIEYFLIITANK